jgi:outer membrane protein OmpA-like peptidoglycan-associated protein
MQVRWASLLLLLAVAGCTWLTGSQKYSVYFQALSAQLDQQGLETIHAAAKFARAHPFQPVEVDGVSAPTDPKRDAGRLAAQRAEAVRQVLVSEGIDEQRIKTTADGIVDLKNLPSVAVRRVDISVGD